MESDKKEEIKFVEDLHLKYLQDLDKTKDSEAIGFY